MKLYIIQNLTKIEASIHTLHYALLTFSVYESYEIPGQLYYTTLKSCHFQHLNVEHVYKYLHLHTYTVYIQTYIHTYYMYTYAYPTAASLSSIFGNPLQSPVLRVPIDKVTFVCHDPADTTVFAVIVRSEETVTLTGLKLYAFQSDQKTVRLLWSCTHISQYRVNGY